MSEAPKGKPRKGEEKVEEVLPEFVRHRIALWDQIEKKSGESKGDAKITITLPNGKEVKGIGGVTTPLEVAKGISQGLF
jgi:hypothetical protein